MVPNHFLYPLNPKSTQGYHFEDRHGNLHPTSYEGFLDCYSGMQEAAEWGIAYNSSLPKRGDFVWAYFSRPTSAIMAVGRVRDEPHPYKGSERRAIWIDWDWKKTNELFTRPIPSSAFSQGIPFSITVANTETLKVLNRWLKGGRFPQARATPVVRFKQVEIEQRQGQPAFRQALMIAYGGRCAVTGCSVRDALQAAHITGIRDGGHHGVSNGILLRADLHNLFDRGLMAFDGSGRVHFSPVVQDKEYARLQGKKCPLVIKIAGKRALNAHRKSHNWAI